MNTKTNIKNGAGRRKTAVARVFLKSGTGKIDINGKPLEQYFVHEEHAYMVMQPLVATANEDKVDIKVLSGVEAFRSGGAVTSRFCSGAGRAG